MSNAADYIEENTRCSYRYSHDCPGIVVDSCCDVCRAEHAECPSCSVVALARDIRNFGLCDDCYEPAAELAPVSEAA